MIYSIIFWYFYCGLLAAAQGILLPAIRRTPPGAEAKKQSFALHVLLTAVYFFPLAWHPTLLNALLALAARVSLFDIVLNHYAGDSLLHVGQTALTDKLIRKLAPVHPETLSAVARLLVAGLLVVGAVWVGVK